MKVFARELGNNIPRAKVSASAIGEKRSGGNKKGRRLGSYRQKNSKVELSSEENVPPAQDSPTSECADTYKIKEVIDNSSEYGCIDSSTGLDSKEKLGNASRTAYFLDPNEVVAVDTVEYCSDYIFWQVFSFSLILNSLMIYNVIYVSLWAGSMLEQMN